MNNAALAAGASVIFPLNNSLLTFSDVVYATPIASNNYTADVINTSGGLCVIRVTNITGGSLSEPVVINFVILKGAIA